MAMLKTTMDEHGNLLFWKPQVGRAKNILGVKAVTEALMPQPRRTSNPGRYPWSDAGHDA